MFRWEAIDWGCTNTMVLQPEYYSPQTGISCNTHSPDSPRGPLSRDSHHQAFDAFDRCLLPPPPLTKISLHLSCIWSEIKNRDSLHIPRIFSTIQILGKTLQMDFQLIVALLRKVIQLNEPSNLAKISRLPLPHSRLVQ